MRWLNLTFILARIIYTSIFVFCLFLQILVILVLLSSSFNSYKPFLLCLLASIHIFWPWSCCFRFWFWCSYWRFLLSFKGCSIFLIESFKFLFKYVFQTSNLFLVLNGYNLTTNSLPIQVDFLFLLFRLCFWPSVHLVLSFSLIIILP